MLQSPEMLSKIAQWRDKQARGEMTLEDYVGAMSALRVARAGAQAAGGSKAKSKAPVDVGALKDSLKALRKPGT